MNKRLLSSGLVHSMSGWMSQDCAQHGCTPDRVVEAVRPHGDDGAQGPGVGFAVVDHDRIVYEGGIGVKDIATDLPVDQNTRFGG